MQGQTIKQSRGGLLIVGGAFVQRDDSETASIAMGKTVPFGHDLPTVEHRAQPGRGRQRQAFGHREYNAPAIAIGQQPLLEHGPARLQRGSKIETAQQAAIGDLQRHTAKSDIARENLAE